MELSCGKSRKLSKRENTTYVIVEDRPNATKHGYVLEHRIVVENNLGRLLDKSEIVHHVNGDKKTTT